MPITIPLSHPSSSGPVASVAPAHRAAASGLKRPVSSVGIVAGAAALMLAGALLQAQTAPAQAAQASAAQTPGSAPASAATAKFTHRRKRPSPAHSAAKPAAPAPQTPATATPSQPEKPKWPAFDKPAEASVVWDSQGLRIDASNSSLEQILKDVSTVTGAKIEGLGTDQRVFGAFGPGQARDVLSQLLQGSGYNVIMIGDQGQGAPRQVLLSVRQAGATQAGAKPASANNEEDEAEEPAPTQEGTPVRPGFPPGAPPRSPQQVMQEMQQRQQQVTPQGQPAPVQPPPNNPQN